MSFEERIRTGDAHLGVIGLGYVGLPLAIEYARAGYKVTGIDISQSKIDTLLRGESYVKDVPSAHVAEALAKGTFIPTTDYSSLSDCDSVNICVPTPLSKTRDPDISYIDASVAEIAKYVHKGMLIILESTTYPGTTEEVILPRLEEKGLKVGVDFFLAFSPERVDPGNVSFNTKNIPKVVGGITPRCTEVALSLYSQTLTSVVPVSSARVAETVKLLENTFRSVNIGLVNEIAQLCGKMDIDVWEVIDAAATKPFGFMPFYPGPGLGGHCIPIDPFYLSWKARASGFEARFIELAGAVNGAMPMVVVDLVSKALNDQKKPIRDSKILMVGVAYKKDIDDVRESPALDVIELLRERGAEVEFFDPWVPKLHLTQPIPKLEKLDAKALKGYDLAVITTAHTNVDHEAVLEHSSAIVDTRNALKGHKAKKLYRL